MAQYSNILLFIVLNIVQSFGWLGFKGGDFTDDKNT